jgi:signal transduction histidine kinase
MTLLGISINISLVFFVYGLAFFCLGLAMLLEANRSPILADVHALKPLAIFGFVHGVHEWIEMLLLNRQLLGINYSPWFDWLRLGMLTLSFSALMVFGIRVLRPKSRFNILDFSIGGLFLCIFFLILGFTAVIHWNAPGHWLLHADTAARYVLAVPGACLAGLAFYLQTKSPLAQRKSDLVYALFLVMVGFLVYAGTQLFVPPMDFFPASWLNSVNFFRYTGFPVQVLRGFLAVLITIGLLRVTAIVDQERQQILINAQQARLDALEQVRKGLEKREAMRRDLLRHLVIAQEEERARIARELHDETAQMLTASTLSLAALRKAVSRRPDMLTVIDNLQGLGRQMGESIRRMVYDLRPAQLDDLGLIPALNFLVDEDRRNYGIEIDLKVTGSRSRLDPLVETVIFRVVQEALTNVARHADVMQAQVVMHYNIHFVQLEIADRGKGFESRMDIPDRPGYGIAGMRERVESVGGQLWIHSAPGRGTTVKAIIPLSGTVLAEVGPDGNSVDAG